MRGQPYSIALLLLLPLACGGSDDDKQREAKQNPAVVATPAFVQATQGAQQVSLSDVAEQAVQSVVNISSTRRPRRQQSQSPFHGNPFFDQFFRYHGMPRERRARSLGSGVIIARDGVILTNNHVIKEADDIEVTISGGRTARAEVVGTDPKSDVAVLRITDKSALKTLAPIALGDSRKLRLGEVVLAIGNPFGVGQTVTMGIVSALGRANMGIVDYEDFIQTDAAINPGNSGGALINMQGQLVGINTAILSKTGGYQGIGFAIPTAMARPIVDSLVQHGRVIRGWLGIVIQSLTPDMARALNIKPVEGRGVLVADVQPGSPAAQAGLQRGDIIFKLDDELMQTVTQLRNKVAALGADAKVKITTLRGGKERAFSVTLGALPEDRTTKLDRTQGVLGGLTLGTLTEEDRGRLDLPPEITGVLVKAVDPASSADSAGMHEDDVVLEINRRAVTKPIEFATIYRRAPSKVLLLVYRAGSTMYLLLEK